MTVPLSYSIVISIILFIYNRCQNYKIETNIKYTILYNICNVSIGEAEVEFSFELSLLRCIFMSCLMNHTLI